MKHAYFADDHDAKSTTGPACKESAIMALANRHTSICSSSRVPALLALTRRADSLLAMRLLILRLSVSVKALESGSPLYAIGRPAFFFFGAYKHGMQVLSKLSGTHGTHG